VLERVAGDAEGSGGWRAFRPSLASFGMVALGRSSRVLVDNQIGCRERRGASLPREGPANHRKLSRVVVSVTTERREVGIEGDEEGAGEGRAPSRTME
jgi:hypothetical protein